MTIVLAGSAFAGTVVFTVSAFVGFWTITLIVAKVFRIPTRPVVLTWIDNARYVVLAVFAEMVRVACTDITFTAV